MNSKWTAYYRNQTMPLRLLFIVIVQFVIVYGCAEGQRKPSGALPQGWTMLAIQGLGSIGLPPEMEAQSGSYKDRADDFRDAMNQEKPDVVLMPTGVNDGSRNPNEQYARVMFYTDYNNGDLNMPLHYPPTLISKDDLRELTESIKSQMEAGLSMQQGRLLSIDPIRVSQMGAGTALIGKYERQLKDNPPVTVTTYGFQNRSRGHTVIFSYRTRDGKIWKPLFERMLKTLTIEEQR